MTGERVGAGDLVEWLTDVGPAHKQVGALLVLGGSDIDVIDVERVLVERFRRLRRFGQRLEQSGRGVSSSLAISDACEGAARRTRHRRRPR